MKNPLKDYLNNEDHRERFMTEKSLGELCEKSGFKTRPYQTRFIEVVQEETICDKTYFCQMGMFDKDTGLLHIKGELLPWWKFN